MKKQHQFLLIVTLVLVAAGIVWSVASIQKAAIENYTAVAQAPRISPDYSGTVIPPNIAPLNFQVKEEGTQYYIYISSKNGKSIEKKSPSPKIVIPEKQWHQLLDNNRGEDLTIDVYTRDANGDWKKFNSIINHIAEKEIDPYVVYRKIHPSHNTWRAMGLYQRNLTDFEETPVLKNDNYKWGCAHCHNFNNNLPDKIAIGIRSGDYKSCLLIVDEDEPNEEVYKLPIKFGFTSWHPSGKMFACTLNDPPLVLHTCKNEMRDIVDVDSWIGYYMLGSDTVRTIPQLSQKGWLENYPTWSPDGKYMYFSNAVKLWDKIETVPPEYFDQSKYGLYRIAYDIDTNQWGDVEPILTAEETGLSLNQPRVSPDGRWVTFSLCEYSCWPSYHPDSDLYILDLRATEAAGKAQYRKMEVSSDECESWHSWSSNSKWILFSSKKNNPLFNRTYMTYVFEDGSLGKAFVLPQEDPTFYDGDLNTYTIPEMVAQPLRHTGETLAKVIRNPKAVDLDMPITGASPGIQN